MEGVEEITSICDDKPKCFDENLKKLCDFLSNMGLTGSAFMILTSDHGPEFLDHWKFAYIQDSMMKLSIFPSLCMAQELNIN